MSHINAQAAVAKQPGVIGEVDADTYISRRAYKPVPHAILTSQPSMISASFFAVALLAVVTSSVLIRGRRRNDRLPYPPGPKAFPVIGSMVDFPQDVPMWKTFVSMGKKYSECIVSAACVCELLSTSADSDVLRVNLLGTEHIVLNSSEAISDLLEKRSAIYSDRVRPSESVILQHSNSVGL
jgi:hypothetical protein